MLVISIVGIHGLNVFTKNHDLFPNKYDASGSRIMGTPPNFIKNDHVRRKVTEVGGDYVISYQYKDHKNESRSFTTQFPISGTDNKTDKFGVPKSMLEPYYVTPEVIAEREKIMKNGMFKVRDDALVPDHNKMATYYKGFTKPIADAARKILGTSASQNDVVEYFLRFCQDIPYGVPPTNFKGKYIGQIFPPSQSLVNMYADCDSKVVLFASAYSHVRKDEMLYIHTPGHLSLAIAGNPGPYQSYTVFKNKKYIFAEPVGPGRINFGYDNKTSHRIDRIDEVRVGNEYPTVRSQSSSSQMKSSPPKSTTASAKPSTGAGTVTKKPPTSTAKGDITFWLNTSEFGKATAFVDGVIEGDIASFFRSQPSCGAAGTLSFRATVGKHTFKVDSRKGHTWIGEFTVKANSCLRLELGE